MTIDHAVAALTFEERLAITDAIMRALTLEYRVTIQPNTTLMKVRLSTSEMNYQHTFPMDRISAIPEVIEDLMKQAAK